MMPSWLTCWFSLSFKYQIRININGNLYVSRIFSFWWILSLIVRSRNSYICVQWVAHLTNNMKRRKKNNGTNRCSNLSWDDWKVRCSNIFGGQRGEIERKRNTFFAYSLRMRETQTAVFSKWSIHFSQNIFTHFQRLNHWNRVTFVKSHMKK